MRAGTELGRTAPRSVFVEKLLFLSPQSGVDIGAEDEGDCCGREDDDKQ